jgi:N-acetylneuraminate synthase
MLSKYSTVYITAEIGICGKIGPSKSEGIDNALKLIKTSALSGADCVKFQTRTLTEVYTQEELNTLRDSPWGNTNGDLKKGLEYEKWEYDLIDDFCLENKIDWSSSPWSLPDIDFLMKYDLPYLKIPSALATNKSYLKHISETKKPLFLSTGMCDLNKIKNIVNYIKECGGKLDLIYTCTSTYPSDVNELNLRSIITLKSEFPDTLIGYSGHERGVTTSVLAVALGTKAIERHVTLDRTTKLSDHSSSLEPKGFETLVRDVRDAEKALGSGEIVVYDSEVPIAKKLRKVDDFE